MTDYKQLTRENFRISGPGFYTFEGVSIVVLEKITGYGSGKKTVYTADVDGVRCDKKDITFYKKMFGIPAGATAPKGRRAPRVPAPVPAEPVPAPAEEETAAASAPAPAPVPEKKEGAIYHEKFDTIVKMLSIPAGLGCGPYLLGPAGSGKSHTAGQAAAALGLTLYYQNCLMDKYDLTGFVDAAGRYIETEFYRAWTKGGLFCLDEMDCSDPAALKCLNTALANGYFTFPGEIGRLEAHPDFRYMACGNTAGRGANEEYTGNILDLSSLDRFCTVFYDYDPRVEVAISKGDAAAVDFVRGLRAAAAAIHYAAVFSYRSISRLVSCAAAGVDIASNVWGAVVRGMDPSNLAALVSAYKGDRKNSYFVALAKFAA